MFSETVPVDLEPTREAYERLLLNTARATIGDDADIVAANPAKGFLSRIQLTSRVDPDRAAVMSMHSEWLEAVFALDPNLGVVVLDDFTDDAYTADQVRVLAEVVHAYLCGEGSLESRRTILGRRRPQLRIEVNEREWLAR